MRRGFLILGRLALAGVFLWAAIAKLRDPWMLFAMQLDTMHVLPDAAVTFVARTLPWFELLLGALLVSGLKLRYVGSLATALLVAFFSVMLILYLRGFQGECGCFGPGEQLGPKTLARDGALVLLSAWVTWEAYRSVMLERRFVE
jgi:putative oxidoreductase